MISIIIPVYNQHEMTRDCRNAVRVNTRGEWEIIVIDNGSNPPIEDVTIRNETNLGFPVAVNQGIRAAKGDVIILLNNDVIVTPGWADRLLYHLNTFDIVAPMANYCAGLQQEVALETYNDDKELNAAAVKWGEAHDKEFIEVNFTIGFCMAFRRKLWETIGDFDESLWPCSGEEIDFCFRAREKGYRIAIARDAFVHHIGSQTFFAMEKEGLLKYRDTIYQNDRHLAKKWGADFWDHQTGSMQAANDLPKSNGDIRLNLGCGLYKIEGIINVDQLESVHPDLIADACNLPFDPGTVDEIYCGHLLEHLTMEQAEKALRHWHSILKPGALIMITVPDFDYLAKAYLENPTARKLRAMNDLYIYSYVQESLHRYCYGPALLKAVMIEAGFGEVERVTGGHPYFTSTMEDQVTYRGKK
ncbi:MAG: glycosyltransferase [Candidatus Babeliales bacterium]